MPSPLSNQSNQSQPPSQNTAKSKKRLVVIVAIIVTALIVAAIVAYVLASHKDSNSQPQANQAQGSANGGSSASQAAGSGKLRNDSKGNDNPPARPATPDSTKDSASNQAIVSAIAIKDMAFSPASATVKKGAPLTWTNDDNTNHAIASAEGESGLHSPQLKPGESYTYTFTKTGTYKYVCALHPSMTGTITVVE